MNPKHDNSAGDEGLHNRVEARRTPGEVCCEKEEESQYWHSRYSPCLPSWFEDVFVAGMKYPPGPRSNGGLEMRKRQEMPNGGVATIGNS